MWKSISTTDPKTNLSPENGFDGNAHDEVEPDNVKALQDQQQPIQQPPGPIRPGNLPALNQNTVNNPTTKTCRFLADVSVYNS